MMSTRARLRVQLFGGLLAMTLPGHASAADAGAVLTCEQIYAVAQTAIRYRDQGHALAQVLSVLGAGDVRDKLDGAQFALLSNAVSIAYLGHATPEEIALECVRARGRN